jgi:hypothetical protein
MGRADRKRELIMTPRKNEVNLCPHGYNTIRASWRNQPALPHNRANLQQPTL